LLEVDILLTHALGEPMMLTSSSLDQALGYFKDRGKAGGERQVVTDADKHPSPLPVGNIEILRLP
jgi:hypothetical protein